MGILDTVPNLMEAIAKVDMELAIVEDDDYKKLYELEHKKAILYARLAALHQKNHIQDLITFNVKAHEWKTRLKAINDKLESGLD